jgi:hypothetical protein
MDNGDIPALDIVHNHITDIHGLLAVIQNKEISAMESRFHATGKDHDNRSRRVCVKRQ